MTDIVAAGMSDNPPLSGIDLRDRIAAILSSKEVVLDGWDYINQECAWLLADAVIAELKLRRETVGLIHRYVTNWLPEAASYCLRCGIPHTTPCKRPADA